MKFHGAISGPRDFESDVTITAGNCDVDCLLFFGVAAQYFGTSAAFNHPADFNCVRPANIGDCLQCEVKAAEKQRVITKFARYRARSFYSVI
ncbi:hypothetical protein CKJ69_17965 [Mycobacterium avium]|nr:hypothetical protein N602_03050 [Mycobacterium avium subsp. hominissuis 10-5606]PBA13508.1 hypothetical protein CKJ69_17965 [Mycobacterium avium]PBA89550.1 hypothetical protein CKJ60_17965 [Mycobacterium avium]